MTYFYTHAFEDLNSSLVDNVFYDEQTQSAYIDLNDDVYEYTKVPFSDIESLVQAQSIGRAFNGSFMQKGFKQKFGPGKHVGDCYSFFDELAEREKVVAASPGYTVTTTNGIYVGGTSTNTTTGKNLTYAADAVVDGKIANPEVRIPLGLPADPVTILDADDEQVRVALKVEDEAEEFDFVVHFFHDGFSRRFKVRDVSWQGAVEKLHDMADTFGATVDVTGVFINLA